MGPQAHERENPVPAQSTLPLPPSNHVPMPGWVSPQGLVRESYHHSLCAPTVHPAPARPWGLLGTGCGGPAPLQEVSVFSSIVGAGQGRVMLTGWDDRAWLSAEVGAEG